MRIRHIAQGVCAIMLLGASTQLQAQESLQLNLHQAVDLALKQNRMLASERAGVEAAHAQAAQYKGMLLPRVSASSSVSRSNSPMNTFGYKLLQQRFTQGDFAIPSLNNPAYETDYQTKLTVEAPIYQGGALWAGKERAEQMASAADSGMRANSQRLIFSVIQAYTRVFEAGAERDAAKSALDAAERHLQTTQAMQRKGIVIKSDVMDAQVSALNAKVALTQTENARENAMDHLRLLLGLTPQATIRLAHAPTLPAVKDTPDSLATAAQASRPDMVALERRLSASMASISEARAGFLPHVGLMATQEWNNNTITPKHPNTTVAGEVSFNLFAGGSDKAAWDSAQAQYARLQYRVQDKRQEIHNEIMDAWRSMQEANSRASEQQQALEQSQESLRIHALRYRQGLERVTDLLSAQARTDHARAAAIHARFDAIIATAHLMLAAGTLTPEAVNE